MSLSYKDKIHLRQLFQSHKIPYGKDNRVLNYHTEEQDSVWIFKDDIIYEMSSQLFINANNL